MRILFIPSWYPDAQSPIRGIFFKELVCALDRKGHDVVVLVPERKFPKCNIRCYVRSLLNTKPGYIREYEENIPVWRDYSPRLLPARLFPLIELYCVLKDFRKKLNEIVAESGPFDIIHAHAACWGGVVAQVASRVLNVPYVITEHRSNILTGRHPASVKLLISSAYRAASRVATVSAQLGDKVRKLAGIPQERCEVIPNMVSPVFIKSLGRIQSRNFTFCCVASMTAVKRHDLLLDAFSKVNKMRPGIHLILVGDGPLHDEILTTIQNRNLRASVFLRGALPPEKVEEVLRKCDALVLASDYETFGVVIAEALAVGLPVIATRTAGPSGIISSTNGFLVPPGDSASLASAMINIIDHPTFFSTDRIRMDARQLYSEDAVIQQTENMYAKALESHARRNHD